MYAGIFSCFSVSLMHISDRFMTKSLLQIQVCKYDVCFLIMQKKTALYM
ncbi:hypothetical protein MAMP_00311 [Methylophaga aminisulfidivorans MP]|uniref:Uncharacterized protein n=1 Tax=Methylophaga aminisulfidivorans MP TaxID=1026882 RepID=F5T1P0_9GAMM|nr:hypothetical protein MAMP_00311 [Methylophaga aminisulfidivorans MP]